MFINMQQDLQVLYIVFMITVILLLKSSTFGRRQIVLDGDTMWPLHLCVAPQEEERLRVLHGKGSIITIDKT